MGAFIFNLCLLLAPLSAAAAYLIIARDNLYAYELSPAGARIVAARVERLNGQLIQLDYDRERLWDDLVAMELMAEDVAAARGFLLSARGMLPARSTAAMARSLSPEASDAEIEQAALQLLTPSTRARYEEVVPLLSKNASSTTAAGPPATGAGERENFELMARALEAQPETDPLQFVLTGVRLGLAGELGPRAAEGAAVLIDAARRDDYPLGLEADVATLLAQAAPVGAFRSAALVSAGAGDPGAFATAGPAFTAAIDAAAMARAKEILTRIGAMSEASSHNGAVALLTHASGLRDLPRLQLVAQGAGDRVAAAAKRLQRDGSLLAAARGELTITRDLVAAIAVAALALLGLVAIVAVKSYRAGRKLWSRARDDDYAADLVELGGNY
ncbi:MAG: hypothetical protein ABL883_08020 [Terricaulis sp.]